VCKRVKAAARRSQPSALKGTHAATRRTSWRTSCLAMCAGPTRGRARSRQFILRLTCFDEILALSSTAGGGTLDMLNPRSRYNSQVSWVSC